MTEPGPTPGDVHELTDESFGERVERSEGHHLVDFWAQWCSPCHALARVLEEVSPEFASRVDFFKLDTSRFPALGERFEIRSVPTLVLFRDGAAVWRTAGVKRKPFLMRELNKALADDS